jgi:hypothetical protein
MQGFSPSPLAANTFTFRFQLHDFALFRDIPAIIEFAAKSLFPLN